METSEVSHFRRCVLEAAWSDAIACLPSLGVPDETNLRVGCFIVILLIYWFLWTLKMQIARFKICQQKYLELLEEQSVNEALHVLRNELAPLSSDDEELHSLSG